MAYQESLRGPHYLECEAIMGVKQGGGKTGRSEEGGLILHIW